MKRRLWMVPILLGVLTLLTLMPVSAAVSSNLLVNGDFETPLSAADWTLTGASGDKRLCGSTTPAPFLGSCMFQFKGGPGTTTLKQTLSPAMLGTFNAFLVCNDGYLKPQMVYYASSDTAETARMQVVVKFTKGNSSYKLKFTDGVTVPASGVWSVQSNTQVFVPHSSTATNVSFAINHTGGNGKLFVDSASLVLDTQNFRFC